MIYGLVGEFLSAPSVIGLLQLQFHHVGYPAFQQFDAQDAVHFLQPMLDMFEPVLFNEAMKDQDRFASPNALHLHGFQKYSSLD